jgi:PhoH-like ATPase
VNVAQLAQINPENQKTAFVLDTSVVVHDPLAFNAFRNTTVAIPIFVVMELDDLKSSKRPEVAASARHASRFISSLREFGSLSAPEGVYHPDLNTTFRIVSDEEGITQLSRSTSRRSMDMLILASALFIRERRRYDRVVLVSKDVNLRILADYEGLIAADYETDRVEFSDLYTGARIIEDHDPALVNLAYVPDQPLRPSQLGLTALEPNEFVILRNEEKEHALRYRAEDDALVGIPRDFSKLAGISPRNLEQRMALSLLMDPEVQLVTLVGKAGTGKTFLALVSALAQLARGRRPGTYDRIILSKPVVAMGQDIGYLPGDFEAKMQPWMSSFFDNLDQIIPGDPDAATSKGASRGTKTWEYLFQSGQLEMQAIHTIRGRSIPNAFMLIDEAQNLTPHEVKTIITRAAEGTKVVLSGDPYQVDNHFLDQHSNGLVAVTERLKDSPITGSVFFTRGERSQLAELAANIL